MDMSDADKKEKAARGFEGAERCRAISAAEQPHGGKKAYIVWKKFFLLRNQ
jgi:hypothetical protein